MKRRSDRAPRGQQAWNTNTYTTIVTRTEHTSNKQQIHRYRDLSGIGKCIHQIVIVWGRVKQHVVGCTSNQDAGCKLKLENVKYLNNRIGKSLVLLVVLFPLPWRAFPVFLGGQSAYFRRGGLRLFSPGHTGSLARALLDPQDHPGASQEPPRATQDRIKIPQDRSKIPQERPKIP